MAAPRGAQLFRVAGCVRRRSGFRLIAARFFRRLSRRAADCFDPLPSTQIDGHADHGNHHRRSSRAGCSWLGAYPSARPAGPGRKRGMSSCDSKRRKRCRRWLAAALCVIASLAVVPARAIEPVAMDQPIAFKADEVT